MSSSSLRNLKQYLNFFSKKGKISCILSTLIRTQATGQDVIQIHVNTRTTSQLRTAIPLRAQTPEKDRSRDSHRHTLRTRQPEGWQRLKLGYNNEVNTFSMALLLLCCASQSSKLSLQLLAWGACGE